MNYIQNMTQNDKLTKNDNKMDGFQQWMYITESLSGWICSSIGSII